MALVAGQVSRVTRVKRQIVLHLIFFLANSNEQLENLKAECNLGKSELIGTTDNKERLEQIYGNK